MSFNKGFGLTTLSVNNTKTVFLIAIVIVIGGMLAYLPKENFPELKIPEIYVGIAKSGSSPKYCQRKFLSPLKKKLEASSS